MVIHCLRNVHLIQQKISLIVIEVKIQKKKAKGMLYMQKKFHADDDNKRYHKLRGHCHYTGKYRGVAHNTCNLRYKISKNSCSIS